MPLGSGDCAATYKILILGDASVGKTALLRCLMGQEFKDNMLPTIAADFVKKQFEVDGALVELHIWDTSGQEKFRSVTRWQYKGVKGVAMVYDITDRSTFTHLAYWIRSVNEEIMHTHNKYEAVPIVLLGNKADLEDKREVKTKEGMKLADSEMAFEFMETSAKTGSNVFDVFRKLAYHVTEICDPIVMKSYHANMIRESVRSPTEYCSWTKDDANTSSMKSYHANMIRESVCSPTEYCSWTKDDANTSSVRIHMTTNANHMTNHVTNHTENIAKSHRKPSKRKRGCCGIKWRTPW